MSRLTKSDIEKALLTGVAVPWTDANSKAASVQLAKASQRRLLAYLLHSKVRDVKGLPKSFIDGIASAFVAVGDPAAPNIQQTVNPSCSGPWKIEALKIEGFGGVNLWNGKPFELDIDKQSILIDGPNGSGKSSLIAAIIWALTGERPRDQGDSSLEDAMPVFDLNGKTAGAWPPVASYPPDLASLKASPNVSVEVTLSDASGKHGSVRREFDGKSVKYTSDAAIQIPTILLEAGLLMPARMPHLRLDEGKSRLTDAVQKLTGLDELIELGAFIQGLCHNSREYLAYKKAELTSSKIEFVNQIERARTALVPIPLAVPNFKASDTDQQDGEMAKFGKLLNHNAAKLVSTISDDLASNLVLTDPKVQQQIAAALDGARKDLGEGLSGLETWTLLEQIATALPDNYRSKARAAIVAAKDTLEDAYEYFQRQEADFKFRLKAAGAHWHDQNLAGPIEACPLCEVSLKSNPTLQKELEALRSAGEAATRSLQDSANATIVTLREETPQNLRRLLDVVLTSQPGEEIENDYRKKFVEASRYANCLVKFKALAEAALISKPTADFVDMVPHNVLFKGAERATTLLDQIERMCRLAEWYEVNKQSWHDWWAKLTPTKVGEGALSFHLRHLSESMIEAEPYRTGADAMRLAWVQGKTIAAIEKEQQVRQQIADDLVPLKQLGNLSEAQARNAITELSGRISAIHSATYIADRLKFQEASLEKKTGLVVRGKLGASMQIDATLIANTSWLRGILWAFLFALREEAVEQIGRDVFPVMALDDPQQTFDSEHRTRWAEQIAKLQKTVPCVQILLTTHEDQFVTQLEVLNITGRRAHICSANDEFGHVAILEGDQLDRKWLAAQKAKTPAAAKEYIAAVREFAEGMMKLMLRGTDPIIPVATLGDCRAKITELYDHEIEPWRHPSFKTLIHALAKGRKEIKWMEEAHHSATPLTMTEATDVEKHWRKDLRPALERSFRIIRDHRALHGGLTALHAFPPSASLPEGHKSKVRQFKLPVLGTAAALSDGRAADGCLDLSFATGNAPTLELKDHFVFRLTKPTLEPVARPNNLLIVRDHAQATPLSLVVALHEDQILARRLQIADNHNDVAVLTANAINPRLIAAPIVAKLSTLTLKKIVGVLFRTSKTMEAAKSSDMEVVECDGEAEITTILSKAKGLVEVSGHSAEPQALDKQFLIIGDSISAKEAEKNLNGVPIIAEDSNQTRYFKRLRVEPTNIILESLEIGGDFPPVLLAKMPGLLDAHLTKVWPVLGVLFEKP